MHEDLGEIGKPLQFLLCSHATSTMAVKNRRHDLEAGANVSTSDPKPPSVLDSDFALKEVSARVGIKKSPKPHLSPLDEKSLEYFERGKTICHSVGYDFSRCLQRSHKHQKIPTKGHWHALCIALGWYDETKKIAVKLLFLQACDECGFAFDDIVRKFYQVLPLVSSNDGSTVVIHSKDAPFPSPLTPPRAKGTFASLDLNCFRLPRNDLLWKCIHCRIGSLWEPPAPCTYRSSLLRSLIVKLAKRVPQLFRPNPPLRLPCLTRNKQ